MWEFLKCWGVLSRVAYIRHPIDLRPYWVPLVLETPICACGLLDPLVSCSPGKEAACAPLCVGLRARTVQQAASAKAAMRARQAARVTHRIPLARPPTAQRTDLCKGFPMFHQYGSFPFSKDSELCALFLQLACNGVVMVL